MNEPDRPRRDVSIEEAERMPMGEGELDGIEARVRDTPMPEEPVIGLIEMVDFDALVAEVRRKRESLRWTEERLADEEERATQAEAEVRRLRALSDVGRVVDELEREGWTVVPPSS